MTDSSSLKAVLEAFEDFAGRLAAIKSEADAAICARRTVMALRAKIERAASLPEAVIGDPLPVTSVVAMASPPTAEKGARETPCDCAIEHTGCREVSKPGVYCKHDHGGEFIDTPSPVSPQGEEGGGFITLPASTFPRGRYAGQREIDNTGLKFTVWLPDGHYVSGKRVQKESGG